MQGTISVFGVASLSFLCRLKMHQQCQPISVLRLSLLFILADNSHCFWYQGGWRRFDKQLPMGL